MLRNFGWAVTYIGSLSYTRETASTVKAGARESSARRRLAARSPRLEPRAIYVVLGGMDHHEVTKAQNNTKASLGDIEPGSLNGLQGFTTTRTLSECFFDFDFYFG